MRLPDNGRYGYPLIRPSTFRAFLFDKTNPYDPDTCLIDGYSLAWNSSPSAISSPTGIAKIGIRTGPSTISSIEQQAMLGDSTFHVMLRIDDGLPIVFYYSNFIGNLYADTGRKLGFYTNGSFAEVETTPEAFVYGEWFLCTLRKRNTQLSSGLPVAGGTSVVELFVNGQLAGQNTNFTTGNVSGTPFLEVGNTSDLAIDSFFYYAEALSDDAIAEDVRRVHQLRTHCRAGLKVTVEDQNGEYRDLTDLNGVDWVTSASISDELDSPTMSATVNLVREQGNQSIAGLVTNSQLNLSNPGDVTSYTAPFIDLGRGIEIYSARVPVGIDPDGRDWFSVFKGNIDEIKESGNSVDLSCRDLGGKIIDTYIEKEYEYGSPDGIYAVEGEMQAILDDNDDLTNGVDLRPSKTGSYEPVTLYTPTTPNWAVTAWRQRREPVMSALRSLAGQIGWDVKYKFDKVSGTWRLTFFQPERESPRATMALTKDDILEVTNLSRNLLGIRNVVRVVYPSSETTLPTIPSLTAYPGFNATRDWNNVDGEGNRMTAYIEIEDTASISRVGRRLFMEVAEASGSQIDTIGEAFDFALGMLLDLNEEDLAKSIDIPLMPEMELNDLPKVMPIPELFTAPQRLAVKRLTHSFDSNGAKTTVEMRGKPAVGQKRWLRLDTRAGGGKPAVIDPAEAISDVQLGSLLGNVRNFLDRTGYFQGGKFIQIRNPNFQFWSSGIQNLPDSWYNPDGGWGTTIYRVAGSASGSHAIRFDLNSSTSDYIISDYLQVDAIEGETFTLEATFSVSNGLGPRFTIRFYDQNKNPVIVGDEKQLAIATPTDSRPPSTSTTKLKAVLTNKMSRTSNVASYIVHDTNSLGADGLMFSANDYVMIKSLTPTSEGVSFEDNKAKINSVTYRTAASSGEPFDNWLITVNNTGPNVAAKSLPDLFVSISLYLRDWYPYLFNWPTGSFNTARRTEIVSPADAKYARIEIGADSRSTGFYDMDSISLYKNGRSSKFASGIQREGAGFGYSENWCLSTNTPWVTSETAGFTDVSRNLKWADMSSTTSPTIINKYLYFECRRSGVYNINASLQFFQANQMSTVLRAVKNAVYKYDNGKILASTPGQSILYSQNASNFGAYVEPTSGLRNYGICTMSGDVYLEQGDRVTIEVNGFISGQPAGTLYIISTATGNSTFISIKEKITE